MAHMKQFKINYIIIGNVKRKIRQKEPVYNLYYKLISNDEKLYDKTPPAVCQQKQSFKNKYIISISSKEGRASMQTNPKKPKICNGWRSQALKLNILR